MKVRLAANAFEKLLRTDVASVAAANERMTVVWHRLSSIHRFAAATRPSISGRPNADVTCEPERGNRHQAVPAVRSS